MKHHMLMAAGAVAALLVVSQPSSAAPSPSETADRDRVSSPHVLGMEDTRLYRQIFADEQAGHFPAARKLATKLSDRSLIGYVEAERFLSPHARHVTLAQLTGWLANYDDLPIAEQIRALAEKKNRRHKVAIATLPTMHRRGGGYEDFDLPEPPLASDAARTAQLQIETSIHAGRPAEAEAVLQGLVAGDMASSSDIARLSHRVAASYIAESQDDAALRVTSSVTGSDRAAAPLLDLDEGLAAYRLGKYDDAAQRFEIAGTGGLGTGLHPQRRRLLGRSRAHMQAGDPLRVVTLLTAATREQPTFYGLLAERLLGQQTQGSFSPIRFSITKILPR